MGGATEKTLRWLKRLVLVSMPHAALWVVQQVAAYLGSGFIPVSMPHAALWVVQLTTLVVSSGAQSGFNAARGFVGGAARKNRRSQKGHMRVSMPHAALWVVQR